MATGKKNYFRHHFRAHENQKIQAIIKKFGVHGYYSYFVLTGLCAELYSESKSWPIVFHESTLLKNLRLKHNKLTSFLLHLEDECSLKVLRSEHKVIIEWPNLLKYVGSYSESDLKEKKVKEIKRKEIKLNETKQKKTKTLNSEIQKEPDDPLASFANPPIKNSLAVPKKENVNKANEYVKVYCELFKHKWETNPAIHGKQAGIIKKLSNEMSLEKFKELMVAFFSMPDSYLIKAKHPIELFITKLNEVTVWNDKRKYTTNVEARQKDSLANNAMLLHQINNGEI